LSSAVGVAAMARDWNTVTNVIAMATEGLKG
jgi:hypothetical protein